MDHDLLIRLDTKFDAMSKAIQTLADGTTTQLTDHETRINSIERLRDQVNPVDLVQTVKKLNQKQEDHDKNIKWVYTALVLIGGVLSWLLANIPHLYKFVSGR